MLNKYKQVYDSRWLRSRGTSDEDILALDEPKTQVQFFYHAYNTFISKTLVEHFGDCRGKKLLEIGCGRATSSIFQALKLGVDIYPTDYSEAALAIAKDNVTKYGLKAHFKQADLYRMPYKAALFDIVISLGVMEHIDEPVKAYAEMFRLLKPGGVMISMNVPEHEGNIQRIAAPVNRFFARVESLTTSKNSKPWLDKKTRSKTADVYRSELYGADFAKLVRKAGFKKVEFVEANPFPTFDPVPRWLDQLIVKSYQTILTARRLALGAKDPFVSTSINSRVHFIVAKKS